MKRYWPFLGLFAVVLAYPLLVRAMPPAGVRWLLLGGSGGAPSGRSHIFFHEPSVSNASLFSSLSWTPPAVNIVPTPPQVTERNVGQSITLSLLYWADGSDTITGLPDDGQPRLRAQFGVPMIMTPAAGGANLGAPSSVDVYVQGNPPLSNGSTTSTVRRLFPYIETNNSNRLDVIFSATWSNLTLPPGVAESQVCVQPLPDETQVGREVNGVWSSLASVSGIPCFTLKAPANIVAVESGDVAVGSSLKNSSGDLSTLQFTSVNGQTLVNGQGWTGCNQFSSLPNACAANTSVVQDGTVSARIADQFTAAERAAKQVAIIGRTGLDPTAFLTAGQSPWRNPRGEVLYVNGPVTIGNVTATGKKLIIAQGDITIGNVDGTTGAQTAFVSLAGDIRISGTRFEGAAIAVGGAKSINLSGAGQLIMKGLLSAPTISFAGRTAGDNTIARLYYDARYQRGELLGLSAILRPLVTEPAF